jgi:DNA-binding transcriptional LysR family regulator
VIPRDHKLARKKSLSLHDLEETPLVALPTDSRTRRVIDNAATSLGLSLNHVVTVSQFATMLGFVRAGVGLAIAPRSGVAGFLGKELSAIPIRGRPLARALGLITLKDREPSPAAAGLMSLVRTAWNKS